MFWTQSKEMPPPACTWDGKCKECGCDENGSHTGECDWSLMRSGTWWIPKEWMKVSVTTDAEPPPPDPRLTKRLTSDGVQMAEPPPPDPDLVSWVTRDKYHPEKHPKGCGCNCP